MNINSFLYFLVHASTVIYFPLKCAGVIRGHVALHLSVQKFSKLCQLGLGGRKSARNFQMLLNVKKDMYKKSKELDMEKFGIFRSENVIFMKNFQLN